MLLYDKQISIDPFSICLFIRQYYFYHLIKKLGFWERFVSVVVLVSNFFLKVILVLNCACTVPLLLDFWFTEQFLEFVNFMSGVSTLYRYKSLSPAPRYAPCSYHIPKNRREPVGTSTSGYLRTKNVEKAEMIAAF